MKNQAPTGRAFKFGSNSYKYELYQIVDSHSSGAGPVTKNFSLKY